MNNTRFRCHPSIILEQLGSFFFIILILGFEFLTSFLEDPESTSFELPSYYVISGILAFLGIIFLFVGYRYLIWSKTWISIQNGSLIYERNTFNKKVNTIGIQSISNINMEQNILERILGTCKVKLDTNSLTTANLNDLTIVMKKSHALELKQYLLSIINESSIGETPAMIDNDEIKYDFEASITDVAKHSLFMLSPFTCIALALSIWFIFLQFSDALHTAREAKGILSILVNLLVIFFILYSALSSALKGFFGYYGFRAKRQENKIILSYGFFKKINYEIPADKINAVEIVQPLFCRIFKRYCVELVNVGLTDEGAGSKAHLILACKLEDLEQQLSILLPELSADLITKVQKQPKRTFFYYCYLVLCTLLGLGIGYGLLILSFQYLDILLESEIILSIFGILAFIILFLVLGLYLYHKTAGTYIGENYLVTSTGFIQRKFTIVKYANIQYITTVQNWINRKLKLTQGMFYLLADIGNQTKSLPYIEEFQLEKLKKHILDF